jgi:hypothetical protein
MTAAAPATAEIGDLVARYHAWLRDRTAVRQLRQWTEITTPFLDRHNDCIQIYARKEDGGFLLTDDAHTLTDLEISGCSLESPKRQEMLRVTLNGFGIRLVDRALEVHATAETFALRKHNLVQAILAVNDLFYLASPTVKSLFLEDVTAWLDEHGVRFLPKVKIPGLSGFDHVFDFAIPRSPARPERLAKAITKPDRDSALSFAFAWTDIRGTRAPEAMAYAIINDNERPIAATVIDALIAYGIKPMPWSQRASFERDLAA